MTRRFSPGGVPTAEVGDYYVRRAEGGVGMVMTEGLGIAQPESLHDTAIPKLHEAAALAAWEQIARRVQGAGAAFVPQLWHVGGYRAAAGGGAGDAVMEAYGAAASAAYRMGCDGVEIHGAHGYLIDQFLWSQINERSDGYGRDLAGRCRLACEVVVECRRLTIPTFPIFFRFSQWNTQEYSARLFDTPDKLAAFLGLLVEAGVDVLHCATRRFWVPEFAGSDVTLAGWTRKLSGKPRMTVGSVGLDNDVVDPLHIGEVDSKVAGLDMLEHLLARGGFDLVGVGRALLADAHWARKIEHGETGDLKSFTRGHLDVLT